MNVMVRAYRDKASKLTFLGASKSGKSGKRLEVCSEDWTTTINVPSSDVFEFDEALFEQIKNEPEDYTREELWTRAKRFRPEPSK